MRSATFQQEKKTDVTLVKAIEKASNPYICPFPCSVFLLILLAKESGTKIKNRHLHRRVC